jgi:hypothetical protein
MRVVTQSMIKAENLRVATLVAIAASGMARQRYIQAMRDGATDDQLRTLHGEAMAASSASDKAAGAERGIRHVEYAE